MKSFMRQMTTLAIAASAAIAGNAALTPSAIAAQFGQQTLNQSRVVAVAAPVGNGQDHQLLIIEQQSNQRQCWSESGSSPTIIDPLLLNFNFSGICGRSTDSNGYSVRLGNEDMNWRYSLRVVHQNNDIVLYAVPTSGNLPTLEVGRTRGMTTDFAKIQLNSGWSMTKRTYNGRALGHIYLSNPQAAGALVAANPPQTPTPSRPVPTPGNSGSTPTPTTPPRLPDPPAPPVVVNPTPSPSGGSTSTGAYVVTVNTRNAAEETRVREIVPTATRVTVNGRSVMQAGYFDSVTAASALVRRFADANLQALVSPTDVDTGRPAVVVGTTGSGSTRPPSGSGSTLSGTFYRVLVEANSSADEARLRSVVPDAFRTTVNGESVWQAGLFREQDVATERVRALSAANLQVSMTTYTGSISVNPNPSPSVPPLSRPDPSARPVPQTGIVVMIDPGHGGRDPGAVGIGGIKEKDINFEIAQRVAAQLESRGIRAIMTRTSDRELDLQPRVTMAERANADLFVSIHSNAISMSRPDVNGLETYYHQTGRGLAQSIHESILRRVNIRDRGVRQANFYVIRNTSMPAVLVETGFVTGREDAARFQNSAARNQIADAIADGIINYASRTALR